MDDVIDLAARRKGALAPTPAGTTTCSFDIVPGVVTLTFCTPDDSFEICLSWDQADLLAARLGLAALRARFEGDRP